MTHASSAVHHRLSIPLTRAVQLRYEVRFGQLAVTYPSHSESDDNSVTPLYPAEARLRNLTLVACFA